MRETTERRKRGNLKLGEVNLKSRGRREERFRRRGEEKEMRKRRGKRGDE